MIRASDIFTSAGILLNDEGFARWTLPEMGRWLNLGIEAIVLAKPSASSKSVVVQLVEGTLQRVDPGITPKPFQLLNITRNIRSELPRQGGRVVRPTTMAQLDAQEPRWHDPNEVRFQREVRHFVFDDLNPLEYYVYPGNDGSGFVEAVVSVIPNAVAATGTATAIASWNVDVGLPEPYAGPLLDYLLYRCQMKDDTAGNAGRAASHYQQFAAAVGLKVQVEKAASPNSRPS